MKKKPIIKSAAKAKVKSEASDKKLHERKNDILGDIAKERTTNQNYKAGPWNEKNFRDDMSGSDLDVPGSELDDQQENIGSEDEENNYYSLGGDNHNNLDEDDD